MKTNKKIIAAAIMSAALCLSGLTASALPAQIPVYSYASTSYVSQYIGHMSHVFLHNTVLNTSYVGRSASDADLVSTYGNSSAGAEKYAAIQYQNDWVISAGETASTSVQKYVYNVNPYDTVYYTGYVEGSTIDDRYIEQLILQLTLTQ
jgi:hypothetical protein